MLSSSSTEYKVNTVLLLGPSQPMKESTTQTLNTIYKITPPCLESLSLTLSSLYSVSLSPHSKNTKASILTKRHFAVTAVLFVFWDAGLQVLSRTPDIHWQTSVPLTLQSLQFSRVIYGARRTHPPCLLLSAFMMLDSHRGPFALVPQPSLAWWARHFLCETQSYYPSTALWWGDKSSLAPFKRGSAEFPLAAVGGLTVGRMLNGTFAFIILVRISLLQRGVCYY